VVNNGQNVERPGPATICRALYLGVVVMLFGCVSTQVALAEFGVGGNSATNPVFNAINISSYDGRAQIVSVGRVHGASIAATRWVRARAPNAVGQSKLSFEVPESGLTVFEDFMTTRFGGCQSAQAQIESALTRIEPYMQRWFAHSALPMYRLRAPPAGNAYSYVDTSEGVSMADVSVAIIQPLPEDFSCAAVRYWVRDKLAVMMHEWMHVHTHHKFSATARRLPDEFGASLIELCTSLVVDGRLPDRLILIEGVDDASLEDILHWYDGGRISASMAGKFAADLIRRQMLGTRELTLAEGAPLLRKCEQASTRLFDLRSAKDVESLTTP
jgi:hypothetical protein